MRDLQLRRQILRLDELKDPAHRISSKGGHEGASQVGFLRGFQHLGCRKDPFLKATRCDLSLAVEFEAEKVQSFRNVM